jgi:hypothetical protein
MRRTRAGRLFTLLASTTTVAFAAGDGPTAPEAPSLPPLEGPTGAVASRAIDRPIAGAPVPRLLPPRRLIRQAPAAGTAADATTPGNPTGPLPPALGGATLFDDIPTLSAPVAGASTPDPFGELAPELSPALEGPAPLRLQTVPDAEFDPRLAPFGNPPDARPRGPAPSDGLEPYPSLGRGPTLRGPEGSPPETPARDGPKRKGDPAKDSALRRKVEEQVRIAAGRHLRSVEVRVVDEKVNVHVRVDRFWHRRAIRRSVEALPALTGVSATVEVD